MSLLLVSSHRLLWGWLGHWSLLNYWSTNLKQQNLVRKASVTQPASKLEQSQSVTVNETSYHFYSPVILTVVLILFHNKIHINTK